MRPYSRFAAVAAFVVSAAVVPQTAQAAAYLTITDGTGVFGNTQVTTPTFSDTFDLSAFGSAALLFTGTISSTFQAGHEAAQNIDFTKVSLNGQDFKINSTGQFEFRTIANAASNLSNFLTVEGTSGTSASYSGTLNVSAVPEPATWAFMIVGVGFAGGMVRRVNRKSEESFTRKVKRIAAA